MTRGLPVPAYPRPPEQVEPYVRVLGADLAVEFLLTFGGAELTLSKDPKGKGRLERLVGYERAKALADLDHLLQKRVPIGNPWIATYLAWKGHSVAEIARRLRVTDVTVRRYLGLSEALQWPRTPR